MPIEENSDFVPFTFNGPKELKDRFAIACAKNDTDMSKELRKMVRSYVDENPPAQDDLLTIMQKR